MPGVTAMSRRRSVSMRVLVAGWMCLDPVRAGDLGMLRVARLGWSVGLAICR
jgi:hypothetical protein